jgi:hypothetical protein
MCSGICEPDLSHGMRDLAPSARTSTPLRFQPNATTGVFAIPTRALPRSPRRVCFQAGRDARRSPRFARIPGKLPPMGWRAHCRRSRSWRLTRLAGGPRRRTCFQLPVVLTTPAHRVAVRAAGQRAAAVTARSQSQASGSPRRSPRPLLLVVVAVAKRGVLSGGFKRMPGCPRTSSPVIGIRSCCCHRI